MKAFIAIFSMLLFFSTAAYSQGLEKIIEKYEGKDGFKTVKITDKMFKMMNEGNLKIEGDDFSFPEIKGLTVLTYEAEEGTKDASETYFKEFKEAILKYNTEEVLSVTEKGKFVKFWNVRSDGGITATIMLEYKEGKVVLLYINGFVDIGKIGKLGKIMDGMKQQKGK